MLFTLPLRRSDGVPMEGVKCFDLRFERGVICTRVPTADRPGFTRRQPFCDCAYEMKDASLTAGRVPGVSFVNGEEHRRPRAKVEWHEVTDIMEAAARHMDHLTAVS